MQRNSHTCRKIRYGFLFFFSFLFFFFKYQSSFSAALMGFCSQQQTLCVPEVQLWIHCFLWHMGSKLGTRLLFGMSVGVYHPLAGLPVSERAVTVSHAYCPCASSSNLSIPPHHAPRILHKMCISRAALSPAHAERTCSVALLNPYHGRISASNSPQLQVPANENAQKREGERERGGEKRTRRDTKSAPSPAQTDTQHKLSGRKGGHISYSPANVIDVGVCISGCVCHAWHSRICWLYFLGIHEKRLVSARAASHSQYPERSRRPGISECLCHTRPEHWLTETPLSAAPHWERLQVRWTLFHHRSPVLRSMEQVFYARLFLDFLTCLQTTFAPE